jgi:hypothetical protein
MYIMWLSRRPESVMADLCLGATIVGINTLIGVGYLSFLYDQRPGWPGPIWNGLTGTFATHEG